MQTCQICHVHVDMRKPVFGPFPPGSDTDQAVQQQKMARGLEFRIKEVKGLYYPCSENKGNLAADLRLCFRICLKGFLMTQFICHTCRLERIISIVFADKLNTITNCLTSTNGNKNVKTCFMASGVCENKMLRSFCTFELPGSF